VILALVACIALVSTGCDGEHRADASPRATAGRPATTVAATTVAATTTTNQSGLTLVIEDRTEAKLTDNFNPFATTSSLGQMGVPFYIYEPLVQYNELGVDQYYPWLAGSWSFSSSGLTMTFDLRTGVKWDNGSSFTAADVAYTFNLLKNNPAIDDGIPIVSATATNATTFTLTLSQPGYAYLYDIARVPIVRSGYAAGANPVDYVDKAPDGTGPYMLAGPGGFTTGMVVLTARRGYWQSGQPAVRKLVFPAYPDSAAVLSALRAGTLDWAATPLPSVQADYLDKDQSTNHYWAPPVDCIALELNLAKGAMGQLAVRRAISDAVDRNALSQATAGVDVPATSSSGLVLPTDKQFLVPSDTKDIADGGDPGAAALVMTGAGYHLGTLGYWTSAQGQVVQVNIQAPVGTAFASVSALAARQLRAAGFDAQYVPVTADRWHRDLADGDFEASVMASATGPSPFYMYEDWLDPALVAHGHASGGNYERLDPDTAPKMAAAVTADLADYTNSLSDSTGAGTAIKALAAIVTRDLPVVPLMYGVTWGEYSTRHATGWPDSQNPYEPATPKAPFAEYTVLQLSPASS
jgi:peptide/nickel transport system substrate-binding protein